MLEALSRAYEGATCDFWGHLAAGGVDVRASGALFAVGTSEWYGECADERRKQPHTERRSWSRISEGFQNSADPTSPGWSFRHATLPLSARDRALLRDSKRAEAMGRRARSYAKEVFSPGRTMRR